MSTLHDPEVAPIVWFPGGGGADIARVGGKGASLVRMAAAGLSVPPGAVLTTGFFAPWIDALGASALWAEFAATDADARSMHAEELKRWCSDLAWTARQRETLEDLRAQLSARGDGGLVAVRSSAPEEDLESASFAGGYETVLGVPLAALEPALRRCFASGFDERVLAYKRERGFDVLSPRMAVVVQTQIASELAGVAFSLNPLTNDHDEAVIDANWGLGESVVAGLAAPDHFVIDKPSGALVEKQLGAKQLSLWLDTDGGTVQRTGYRASDQTLTEDQLAELVRTVCRIEALYGQPVDVEWARAGDALYVLQARPVTAFVPVPPEMQTLPGERRRLYADAGLSQGLTTNRPISPFGLAWLQDTLYAELLEGWLGIDDVTPAGGLVFAAGCRFYLNLSNAMRLGMTPKQMAKNSEQTDALLAEILTNVDAKRYRAPTRPAWLRPRLLLAVPRVLWELRGFFGSLLRNLLAPERGRRAYQRRVDAFEAELVGNVDFNLPVAEFARMYTRIFLDDILNVTLPALIAGLASPLTLLRRRATEARALAEKLGRGLPGNLVVEQGIALHRMAALLPPSDFDDLVALAARIEKRLVSEEFLREWDAFLRRFGCRGPHEVDPASSRYADDPTIALQQMSYMAVGGADFDPEVAHRRNVEERRSAYEELLRRFGWLRRALLRRIWQLTELFGGTRDTPKYHLVMVAQALRERAVMEGERLVAQGRLDAAQDVFGLTLRDLDAAGRDAALDLRALRAERTRFNRLAAHVTAFPHVFDSRGRILRPAPREGKPGELVGMPVSPGSVSGPVKVLHDPREKPVEPGDVLVAYTTDPGWTPLFVNAAAVVLEVGGVLQHGAVIAREYRKPCVAGVDRVVARLRDGQRVEVDGTAGVIRLLDEG